VLGIFESKDDALKLAERSAGSNYKWIEDEERWESPDRRSVWISEEEIKCKQKD